MSQPIQKIVTDHAPIGLTLLATSCLLVLVAGFGLLPEATSHNPRVLYFHVGTEMAPEARPEIAALAADLAGTPETLVLITGHTGPDGDPIANQSLSLARAHAVADALKALGIPGDRIRVSGAGSSLLPPREKGESDLAYERRLKRASAILIPRRLTAPGDPT